MIIKFSNNNNFCTHKFYFESGSMNCSLAGETAVRESVSPGFELGHCLYRDGKADFACEIIRPIFQKINRFHKSVAW